jgi:molecular chaperone GrpE
MDDPLDSAQSGSAAEFQPVAGAEPRIEIPNVITSPSSHLAEFTDSQSFAEEHEPSVIDPDNDSPVPAEPATMDVPEQPPSPTLAQDSTGAELVAAVGRLEDSLSRRLDGLQKSFDRELRAEATRERIVERLHSELQDYKQDFLLKVQRPIFIDLIQLHDDIGKMIEAPSTGMTQTDPTSHLVMTLESIQTAIEDILYRQGVEPFSIEGNAFDPRQQRAVTTQPTTDPSLNKQIATRLRKGFRTGDKLIRPEIVTVFTYRSPT